MVQKLPQQCLKHFKFELLTSTQIVLSNALT